MAFAPSANRIVLCVLLASTACGCGVDDRILHASGGTGGGAGMSGNTHTGGRAGAGTAGTSNMPVGGETLGGNGGSAGGSSAGAAGSSGLPELVDGCVDLDQNQVSDCTETLVANAAFEKDVADWKVGSTPALAWSEQNRAADEPSGSAAVAFDSDAVDADGFAQSAAAQCLPITGGTALELRANAYIQPDQGEGLAALGVWFYEAADCSGPALTPFEVVRAETGVWLTLSGTSTAPANATSMIVRLAVGKPFRSRSFAVLFDNVLVRPK